MKKQTRKNMMTRPISIILILCVLISLVSVAAVTTSAETVKYISDIRTGCADSLSAAKKILTDEGYTVIHHDMNNKVPNQKKWIYIGYKTSTNIDDAITGLVFSSSKQNSIKHEQKTYNIEKGQNDFNAGAGGDYIYLYYTKDKSNKLSTTEYLTALDVAASTDDFSLYKKNYKTVNSVSNKYAQNGNAGVTGAKPCYLTYNSVLDSNAYQKQGKNDLAKTLKAANDVTYYDTKDNTASANFMKTAMSAEHNGVSQVELWADVFYSMLEIKGQGNGYRNDTGNSFDQMYGKGDYIDMVSALKNGTGNKASDFWKLDIQSTGLQSANSPQNVYTEVINMFTSLKHGDVGVGCSDYNASNIESEVVDLDDLKNTTSSSDVLYTMCRVSDDNLNGSQSGGHDKSATVMGMMFYNFQFVPIIQDGKTGNCALNYSEKISNEPKISTTSSTVVNETTYNATRELGFSTTTTNSATNSLSSTRGTHVAYTQGLSIGASTPDGFPVGLSAEVSIGFEEAFDFSNSQENSKSFEKSSGTSTAVTEEIPAYTIGETTRKNSVCEITQTYDCPMALTYDVAMFATSAELGKENMFYTSFAYNSSLFAKFGDDKTNAVECLEKIENTDGAKTNGFSVKCIGGDDHETVFEGYSQNDWFNIINNNVASGEYPISSSDAMNRIVAYQPMSFNGGTIKSEVESIEYDLCKMYSILPIEKVTAYKTYAGNTNKDWVSEIKLSENKEYRFQDYFDELVGYSENNVEFTNWDMSQGYWVLVDEDGNEHEITTGKAVSDGIISVEETKAGNIYITPKKSGHSYLKFKINETGYFQYYDYKPGQSFNTDNIKDCTNDMIKRPAVIEIVSTVE